MAKRPRSVAPEERRLFEKAVADARPLEQNQRAPAQRQRLARPLSEGDREVLEHLDKLVSGELPFEIQDTDEFIEGAVEGLDPQVSARLRRGEFAVQENLDLHGAIVENARDRVERFLLSAHARGLRCVRIVHGRGRNSPRGVPVLKQSLPRWLQRGPARRLVLAWASALPRDGGGGATYVLLRGKGARRPPHQPL